MNWKFKLPTILEGYNLWSIVRWDEPKPTVATSILDWEKREMKEKVLLCMSVKDNMIPHIRDCKTSNETRDMLKGLYETKNTNRILFLKTKLLSIKMEANENIRNFISRVKDLSDKLGDIGEKVSSTDLVTITLNGLVQDCQFFISSLLVTQKPHTFDELT